MLGQKMILVVLILLVGLWAPGSMGLSQANSLPAGEDRVQLAQLAADEVGRTEVEIYRRNIAGDDARQMRELCRRFEEDSAEANSRKRTEVEIYRKDTGPGETEYHREYRESNRYAGPAPEDNPTIRLCRQLEESAPHGQPDETEVKIYRRYTVPDDDE